MLTHICRHDWISILREVIEPPDNMLRFDRPSRILLIDERMCLLPFVNLTPPGLAQFPLIAIHRGTKDLNQLTEHHLAITDDWNIDIHILPNRSWIDIDVDNLRMGAKLSDLSSHTIVKPCSDGHDKI